MKNPATSSDSASGRSNGVRFVSANADRKKIKNSGNNGTINHTLCCHSMIVIKLSDPVTRITVRIAELRISSYEIIWAVLRSDPRKAYLLLALQPANKIP